MGRGGFSPWAGPMGLALFLGLWHVGSLMYNPVILPSPFETARALVQLGAEGKLARAAADTGSRTLAGFGLALLLGGALGIAAGLWPAVRQLFGPIVTILQGIPPIAWIVLALLWFGTGGATPVFTVVVATLPVVFASAAEGVRTADRGLLEMARTFRAGTWMLLWDHYLPHLLSYLFPATVAGLGVAWKVAVMAELLATDTGIGAGLGNARVNLDTARALAWVALVVLLLAGFEYLVVRPLSRMLEPWRQPEGGGQRA